MSELRFEISPEDAERYWLTLRAAHEVAVSAPDLKAIRNWTDRGLIDVEARHPGANTPRLYSLISCLQISVLGLFSFTAGSLTIAKKVADVTVDRLRNLLQAGVDFGKQEGWAYLVYRVSEAEKVTSKFMTTAELIKEIQSLGSVHETRIFRVDELLAHQVQKYLDYMAEQDKVYAGCDERGNPLDPDHPWNWKREE
jgi:hypothetical protein